MDIVFVSNYLSNHQLALCDTLYDMTQGNFMFVSVEKLEEERINMGWSIADREYNILYALENADDIKQHINYADVVIIGSAPDSMIMDRLKSNRLTIKYCERFFKQRMTPLRLARGIIGTYIHYARFRKHKFYILCSSAYTAADVNKFFNFSGRTFKWGYFPPNEVHNDIDKLINNKEKTHIIWSGRFIDWKHPEYMLSLATRLKEKGYDFHITMVGNGEMQQELEARAAAKGLNDHITFTGAVKQEDVRGYMEQAGIFVTTSDRGEGWGAVLNEAMNSGCACVSSHAVGAAPFLIKENINGLLFRSEDVNDLYIKVKQLLDDKDMQSRLGKAAYKTIDEEWNAHEAAIRLIRLSESLLKDTNANIFREGPCSKSEILSDNWY